MRRASNQQHRKGDEVTQEIVGDYATFIQDKALAQIAAGFDPQRLGPHLFDFQAAIVE